MIRARIAAAVVVLAGPLLTPTSPARADPGLCEGVGSLNTPVLMFPIIGVPNSGSISGDFGPCVHGLVQPRVALSGFISGNCGSSNGTLSVLGHSGSVALTGTLMVMTGGVSGTINAVPSSGSCLTGVTQWDLSGAFALA